MRRCVIAGAGPGGLPPIKPVSGALVIAADGGYRALLAAGIAPDAVIGDFDSLPCPPEHPNALPLPREKDDTDMLAAIRLGLSRGCDEFHLYGGMGGRLDHTLANIQCLAFLARQGARGFLHGEGQEITCVQNGSVDFGPERQGMVSVFSHSDVSRGVCLEGLKYPLREAALTSAFPIGVSNEFMGKPSRISVREGVLLILYPAL